MDDAALFEELLLQELGKHVLIRTPQRGYGRRLVELAEKNAREEAERATSKGERRVARSCAAGHARSARTATPPRGL